MNLNIGSDFVRLPMYMNVDIRPEVRPDIVMDARQLAYPNDSIDEINFGNILEHLTREDGYRALGECRRVLKRTGRMFITLPLIDVAEECHRKGGINEEKLRAIIQGEGHGPNMHRSEFRTGMLEQILFETGFRSEPLDLRTFMYIVVSNVNDPRPDPWQYGVTAFKIGPETLQRVV